MEEPIRIFSDFHLGHPACRIDSIDRLRPLFEGAATVVINGDASEMRHSQLIDKGSRQLAELKAFAKDLGVNLIFLRGNHDPGVSEIDSLDLAGGAVFLTHGDALFKLGSPWSPRIWKVQADIEAIRAEYGEETLANDLDALLECAHRCRDLMPGYEKEFKTGFLKTIRTAIRIAWPPRRPLMILHTWLTSPGVAAAFATRHRPDARVFAFGHTHWPGAWKRKGRLIVNTGGFISVVPAMGIEIAGKTVSVRKVSEENDRFSLGKEVASLIDRDSG